MRLAIFLGLVVFAAPSAFATGQTYIICNLEKAGPDHHVNLLVKSVESENALKATVHMSSPNLSRTWTVSESAKVEHQQRTSWLYFKDTATGGNEFNLAIDLATKREYNDAPAEVTIKADQESLIFHDMVCQFYYKRPDDGLGH